MRAEQSGHPLLYEINTRVWVRERGEETKRRDRGFAGLPDSALDEIAALHFDWVWLMGVWQTGPVGRRIARGCAERQAGYKDALPDLTVEDVIGSPYAVQAYRVSPDLGGPAALAELRRRLARRGVGLVLDFVPNHTARDHDWLSSHPEFYVPGDEESLRREPEKFFSAGGAGGTRVFAHGRDPNFPGWTDTAQLNYRHRGLRAAMVETLLEIAARCDGVRCDMSMLALQEVFAQTWGDRGRPPESEQADSEFWTEAIQAVRRRYPGFLFIAEAYWGREPELQALGFDYTYDKGLYDRLVQEEAGAVRHHLGADPEAQARAVRFLENHDESRAAQVFPPEKHRAAALICYAAPGMRFFHEGQLDGRKVRVPVQLRRRRREPQDRLLRAFYEKLLAELAGPILRRGRWKLLEPRSATEGNKSWEQFVIQQWEEGGGGARLAAANYGARPAQCRVSLDLSRLGAGRVILRDLFTGVAYENDAGSLRQPGLLLDLAPYQIHFFAVSPAAAAS